MYFLFLLDFILVEILKFFAALSKHFADLLESHHGRFLNTLCCIIGSDETSFDLLEAAIDCLTVVLSYDGGKFALNNLGKFPTIQQLLILYAHAYKFIDSCTQMKLVISYYSLEVR